MLEDLDGLMEAAGVDAVLVQGNAFQVPDVYWLTGFRSPDEIIVLHNRGEDTVVAAGFNAAERVGKESFITRIHDITELYLKLMSEHKRALDEPGFIYGSILKELFSGDVIGVPTHLPAHIVLALKDLGYTLKPIPRLLLSARARKSSREIESIEKAGRATVAAIGRVIDMIADTTIGPNRVLMHNDRPLTVNDIKIALDHYLVDERAESAEDAIVAVGTKGFDWHYLGKPDDRLKAEVPIIIDVFPRLKIERYVGDVTRTVVRGPVSDDVRAMFDAVSEAHDAAADVLSDGVKIDDVNMACYETLKRHGYDSRRLNPRATEGMTHGLGHGIGLEVHEGPDLYMYESHFAEGHVITIEPGVYLKSLGGVRIENDYLVTKGKARLLSSGLDNIQFL